MITEARNPGDFPDVFIAVVFISFDSKKFSAASLTNNHLEVKCGSAMLLFIYFCPSEPLLSLCLAALRRRRGGQKGECKRHVNIIPLSLFSPSSTSLHAIQSSLCLNTGVCQNWDCGIIEQTAGGGGGDRREEPAGDSFLVTFVLLQYINVRFKFKYVMSQGFLGGGFVSPQSLGTFSLWGMNPCKTGTTD